VTRARKKPIPPTEPASCVLMDYGGYSVWMKPEKAADFAASLRKRGRRCYIVRRKVKP
jgi:hypothetical protein